MKLTQISCYGALLLASAVNAWVPQQHQHAPRAPASQTTSSKIPQGTHIFQNTIPPLQVNTLWPKNWIRTNWMSSLVYDDNLYLTGGGVTYWYLDPSYGLIPPGSIIGSILRIDLKQRWTTETVTASYADKPKIYPHSRGELFWTDGYHIYAYGGLRYFESGCGENCPASIWRGQSNSSILTTYLAPHSQFAVPIKDLWHVPSQPWSIPVGYFNEIYVRNRSDMFPAQKEPFQGSAGVTYQNKQYALGGFTGWPYEHHTGNVLTASPSIVSFKKSGAGLQNRTAPGPVGIQPGGTSALSKGVAAPYGPEGTLLFVGGYTPGHPKFLWAGPQGLADMSVIQIYDINSGNFTTQRATGDIPDNRWNHCAVGVYDKASGGFDMYVFGGNQDGTFGSSYNPSLVKVYVLSIPSFVWTEATHNVTPEEMRAAHTCTIGGKSQMISVGGMNPTDQQYLGSTTDPWPNGIGIFDLNSWEWKNTFDPSAGDYKRPDVLNQVAKKTPYPKSFDSNLAAMLFDPNKTPYHDYNAPPDTGSSINTAAIAGGVVGGVVGVALIVAALFFWRRKRKTARYRDREASATSTTKSAELPGHSKGPVQLSADEKAAELNAQDHPLELGPPQVWELDASSVSRQSSSSTRVGDAITSDGEATYVSNTSPEKS